jgi:hypothetical protein
MVVVTPVSAVVLQPLVGKYKNEFFLLHTAKSPGVASLTSHFA